MKTKFNLILIAVLGLIVSMNSCNNGDDPIDPVEPNETTYKIGTTVYSVNKEKKEVSTKGFGEHFLLEFSVDNILNSKYKAVYPYAEEYDGERISIKYTEGLTYGLKIKYLIK